MTPQVGYEFHDEKGEHLHTLHGKALTGTSTVLGIIAKPLTWWASGEAVKTLGWTPITEYVNGKPRSLPKPARIEAANEFAQGVLVDMLASSDAGEQYLSLLDKAYKAHTLALNKAAGKGVDLHAQLEKYVKYCIEKGEGKPIAVKSELIQNFIDWSVDNVETFIGSEVHTYSEKHWLGGIVDCVAKLKTGKTAIIDFKSSKAAYENMFLQCGGYSLQLQENGGFTNKGTKLLEPLVADEFIIIPFGAPSFVVESRQDATPFEQGFISALNLYRLLQQ